MHHLSPETAAIYQMAKHAEEEAAAARKKIEEALQAQVPSIRNANNKLLAYTKVRHSWEWTLLKDVQGMRHQVDGICSGWVGGWVSGCGFGEMPLLTSICF
jgi:hypothetical protein